MQQTRKLVGRVTPPGNNGPDTDADGKVIDPVRPRCGAHSRRTGRPCRNWAMANGRCRLHGGKSTGPKDKEKASASKLGNKHTVEHGLYAVGMHPEEKDIYGTIAIGSLQDEIKMTKLLLRRACRAQLLWEVARGEINATENHSVREVMIESGLYDVDELITETGVAGVDKEGNIIDIDKQRIARRKTSFADEIRHYERLLAKLEETHARLQEAGTDEDTVARLAEDLRAFTDNAGALMPGGEL